MKRTFRAFALSICMILVGTTAVLLLTPITAFAAECSVDCQNGTTITCTGTSCARDEGSCWGTDSGVKRCPLELQ